MLFSAQMHHKQIIVVIHAYSFMKSVVPPFNSIVSTGKGRYDEWPECRMLILDILAGMTNGRYAEWPE